MYIMLKELNTPFKVVKFIYAADLMIVVGFIVAGVLLQNLVYSDLKIPFFIFNLLVGCFITAPSFANPQKRSFQSLFLLLRRTKNKRVYYPIPIEYTSDTKIEMRKSRP